MESNNKIIEREREKNCVLLHASKTLKNISMANAILSNLPLHGEGRLVFMAEKSTS